ncbi:hypothetical protein BJY04DRAFT_200575 [Aspergillus karnatakaensis]|uniref:uncharacterized protein n=1 Tax=Aspergillus karnatakaensis TaxID=1810916 RepID=UPI003CCDC6C9
MREDGDQESDKARNSDPNPHALWSTRAAGAPSSHFLVCGVRANVLNLRSDGDQTWTGPA